MLSRSTLEQFRKGDAAAFEQVVRTGGPLVRAAVARYFKTAFDREEAMQEIWIHVFRNRQALDLDQAEHFSGWLAVLARRRCIDLLRQAKVPLPAEDVADVEAWLASAADHDDSIEAAQLLAAAQAFRSRLKPTWRRFFELYFIEGHDYEAIAQQLSIGKLRCKYMRMVLARRAQRDPELMAALGRQMRKGTGHAL